MHKVLIMLRCAVSVILAMLASTGEVPKAYTWGLSEIHKQGGTCEASSHFLEELKVM